MKVYIDSFGNIKKVLDNVFVANSTMYDNIITWYFVDDNGDVVTNEEVSYCAMSMLRSDGHLISRINCPLTMTEEGYGYRYVCTQYDGILMVAGALQITAQFVKATIEDEEITDRETLCTTVVEGHVKINYGIDGEEYFNDVLEQAMLDRDTLQAEINELRLMKVDYDEMTDKPIVNQDLGAQGFIPVAGTYYRNTGTNDYTKGGIYFYDGRSISSVVTYSTLQGNLEKKQDVNVYDLGGYSLADIVDPNYVIITEDLFNAFKSGKYQFIKVYSNNANSYRYFRFYEYLNSYDIVKFVGVTSVGGEAPIGGENYSLTTTEENLFIMKVSDTYRLYISYTDTTLSIAGKQNTLTPDSVSTVSGANGSLETTLGFTSTGTTLRKATLKTINNEALATRQGGNIDLVPSRLNTLPDLSTSSSRMNALIYVDNNGTGTKVSMHDMFGMFIRQGATQPSDMQAGEYLFLEKGEE